MRVALITQGDPETLTGGYLYHRRVAALAERFDASFAFVSAPAGDLRAARSARSTLMEAGDSSDVVVLDSIVAAPLSFALRKHRRPIVGMLHQEPGGIDGGRLQRAVQRPFDRIAYRAMGHLMVASEQLRRRYLDEGFPDEDITVVAPGCDSSGTTPPEEVGDLRSASEAAFLCVGNWMARKGIIELLHAWEQIPAALGRLHLVGDTSVEPRYTRQVRRRLELLGERVVVHGAVSRKRVDALYRAADVFVLPSFREPYGTVYGEAMAAGLPVVGWRAGNLPFLIEDGREGLMCEPGDIRALADSLLLLARDEELRTRMARAAREGGSSLPTWEETAQAFYGTLRRMMSR